MYQKRWLIFCDQTKRSPEWQENDNNIEYMCWVSQMLSKFKNEIGMNEIFNSDYFDKWLQEGGNE